MRIVIDMQGAQTESRFRGIGRYTMSFAQGVVRNKGEHEVILALSGLFPETIEPIRAAFEGLLPQENIRVWHAPGPVAEEHPGNETRREVAELIREAFLASLQPDVIHVCSLFEGYVDDAVTSIGKFDKRTPVSVALYDLIPLLNPEQYLKPNPRYEQYYQRKLAYLKQAACFLAISDFAREEGVAHLRVSAQQIVNVSTAIEPHFRSVKVTEDAANQLRQKFNLNSPFVLYTGGADERKNLPRLIQAWGSLPPDLRKGHQLLFAGRMPEGDIARFKQVAQSSGMQESELLFTGYVSDEELVQLYNLCKLYVFPSWHEGFGLPALEAMACGAPVIGANTSSLPEVIGLDEAQFDPMDVYAIATKMRQALEDESFCNLLRSHGQQRAKLFSWDETAKRAIAAWDCIMANQIQRKSSWKETQHQLQYIYQKVIENISKLHFDASEETVRLLAKNMEKNERQIDSFHRANKLPKAITWRLEGPFDSSYSLALVNREIARALSNLGHKVVLHSTEGTGDFDANIDFLDANPSLAAMNKLAPRITSWDSTVTSRNLYPPRVTDMVSPLNFLHAYAWEESGFPLDWIDNFNQSLQGMTVTSRHVGNIMVNHGFTKPVDVCSNGVDHWLAVEADEDYQLNAKQFRFLHVSSCFPRKGVDVLLKAFGLAFRDADAVTLVIKTFSNPHNEVNRWLKEARANDPHYPDVQVIEGDFTDAQLKALYEQCDVLVAPSRAEGFGLPMAEAMLSGLAVITTGWSGQTDFCTEETAWLIDYRFERAKSHFGLFSSVWAEPDQNHLTQLMKVIRDLPPNEREIRVKSGQKLLLDKFKWQHTAARMVDAARRCGSAATHDEAVIGWISTWNTKCGIATYSEHLIKNMDQSVSVLAPYASELTGVDQSNVYRSWSMGEEENFKRLEQEIERLGINTLMVQFNYGFFNLENFSEFLHNQSKLGRAVVVTLHSTADPIHASHKKLKNIASALKGCSRVLVHSIKDLNKLKDLGLSDNLTLIPHGVLDYRPIAKNHKTKNINQPFVVASYGFFLPHKGLLELIDAISLMKNQGFDVRLKMVNSEYPAIESRDIIFAAKNKIKYNCISDIVELHTSYLEDDESLSLLSSADLIIFPYQETGESASGAVRYGIATGLPVAVTPLAIFDDVSAAVHKLPGTTASDIAQGIQDIAAQIHSQSELFDAVDQASRQWRAEHSYTRIGRRIGNMLYSLWLNKQINSRN